jgi:hypothetical protein
MPRWCYRLMGGTAATPLASLLSMHRELWRCAECSEVTNNVRPPHKIGNEKSASVYECARFTRAQNRPRNLLHGSQPK